MELVLQREILSDKSTIGRLSINDDEPVFYTLEDVVRPLAEKLYGRTAAPAGRYRVVINESQRFKRQMPLLLDVPGFTGVRIHSGNTSEDTEGCILVGLTKGTDFIGESRKAFDKFFPILQAALQGGGEVWLDVRNPPQVTLDA